MSEQERVDWIMRKMGFDPADTNEHVAAWRAVIAKKVSEGMRNHSYGTWAVDLPSAERARAMLEVDWAIERGYSSRIEAIDGLDPKNPAPWIRDQGRRALARSREFADKTRGIRNPYAESQQGP